MTGLLWLAEFLLESSGAALSFRKYKPLFFYLAFRAVSDVAIFLIRYTLGDYAYGWAYWGQQAGAALLLCWLCVAVFAQMVGEDQYGPHATFLCVLGLAATVIGALRANSMAGAILGAAVNADLFLGLAMLVGLMSKKSRLSAEWTAIAWAACIHLGSEGTIRRLAHYDERALAWLPLGALMALGVWIATVWPRKAEGEVEAVIPPRFQPESVTMVEEEYRGWVN